MAATSSMRPWQEGQRKTSMPKERFIFMDGDACVKREAVLAGAKWGKGLIDDSAARGARGAQGEEQLGLRVLVEIVIETAVLFQKLGDARDDLVEQGGDVAIGGGIEGQQVGAGIGVFVVGDKDSVGHDKVKVEREL